MYPNEVNKYRNVFFQNLIHAMADKGVECTVVSPVSVTKYKTKIRTIPKHKTEITDKGNFVQVYYPRFVSLSSKRIGSFNTGVWTEYLFQKCAIGQVKKLNEKFDIVYGHFFISGGLAAIKIAKREKIPSIIAYGECNYDTEVVNQYRDLIQEDIEGLNGIVAVSTNNANILREKSIFNDIPTLIAPNAVNFDLFYKQDKGKCRAKLGIPKDVFVVGFVGGFIERKGDKRLLKAVEMLDDVYVAFAGRGSDIPKGERVVFCQALSHEEIPIFLNAIDVFCLPTLNEGSCNALVEAAACGLPIISSDLPFNDDLLTADNSIRIDPMSVEDIKNAISRLVKNKENCNRFANNIYQDVQAFSIDKRCERILNFIGSVKGDMEGEECHE